MVHGIYNLSKEKIETNLIICNGEDLPYKSNSYEIILNFGSINQFENVNGGLLEMTRVCKKGGLCICRDEHYDKRMLTKREKDYFSFIKKEKIPIYKSEVIEKTQIEYLNSVHFLLYFFKKAE